MRNDIGLLSEEVRRVQCARYGLMSLNESAYIIDPVMRPYALLEAKSIIRFGLSTGYYPPHYSKLLESNDVIALRLATTESGELAHRKLDESFGMDLALGIGQMIPGVKTFAGIAGVAYYAYQAYDNFSGGSTLGGVGNLFLTLLSAAAIEPLGATSFVGPIVTALGPLTKLGQAFESFLGLIIKGAFGPVAKLLMKFPPLKAFVEWVGKAGMPALEQAGGWLGSRSTQLAKWLEGYAAKNAAKVAEKGAEGRLASVAKYLSGKVGTAAEMMGKFITNMKTFITSGGAEWAAKAELGAAKAEAGAAGAATKAATAEASAAVKASDDAYKALVNSQFKSRPDLAAKYAGNEATLLDDIAKGNLTNVDSFQLKKAAESLSAAKAGAASAEAAAAKAGTETVAKAATSAETQAARDVYRAANKELNDLLRASGVDSGDIAALSTNRVFRQQVGEAQAAAIEAAAAKTQQARAAYTAARDGAAATSAVAGAEGAAADAVAAPTTQTAGALKNLGSAMYSDLRSFHSALDQAAGKLLTKAENAQIKSATRSMIGNPVKFKFGDGRVAKVVYADAKTGKVFKTLLNPKTGKMGAPVETSIMDLMKTNAGRSKLAEAGLDPKRFNMIARALTRGFSSGASEVPDAEAAAGL